MRILQVCSAGYIGGGERHVIDLSNELARRGHDVFVALTPGSPIAARLKAIPAANIGYQRFRNAVDIPSAAGLARFIGDNRIEVINAHLAKDYPVTALASLIGKVPYVITRHVLFPMSRSHIIVLGKARYVIAPSNAVAASLFSGGIFPAEKIRTVRYGLDAGKIPGRVQLRRKGFRIGAIGNIDPVKGFDTLVIAAGIVTRQAGDAVFEIVGSDRSADLRNERELKTLIDELALSEKVVLSGFCEDIPAKLATFDLFVSSSRSESFGFVIAEAMLAGLPVVATATEGAKEIISDPSVGIIVPVDSPEQLAAAILALLHDHEKRSELSVNGSDHIRQNFSLEQMVDETESVYTDAVT